ncbi:DUF3800 domain-containing protein [Nocardioides sp. NPDC057767]|uniref:DUF3800 domain-containing protein n=1 Tax=unclassified Nocardioides TaxID=2615069 RepID=UPI00366EB283
MLLAYVDETGDTGDPALAGSSACYALGCVLVEVSDWPEAFDAILAHRRRIRDTFGVLLRDELKANYLIRGSGPLKRYNLSPDARHRIYRSALTTLQYLPARAFTVVTDKTKTGWQGQQCFEGTWEMLLQRLERTSFYEGKKPLMIIHDEGENDAVRRMVRKARRHLTAGRMFGGGTVRNPIPHLIDDPSPRASNHSYFVQMADLVAYAGWRTYMHPSKNVARVVPPTMWDHLGDATHRNVNAYSGGAPGVVVRK